MRIYLAIASLLLVSSCGMIQENKPKKYDESRELLPDPEGYKKDTFIISDSLE